ncbi:5'-3' exoribonuclease 2-like [Saccoglossus kowalevskii]
MYYFHGCPSWQWFYPYHYAPFAMDFKNITHLQNDFEVGEPLKPLEQLMAILPPSNDHLLPITWRPLMIGEPGDSPIRDFYPGDFEIDLSGERYTSQGVARIPFVDETRMKKALEGLQLTRDEECRNRFGNDVVFLDVTHPAYVFFKQFGNNNDDDEVCAQIQLL